MPEINEKSKWTKCIQSSSVIYYPVLGLNKSTNLNKNKPIWSWNFPPQFYAMSNYGKQTASLSWSEWRRIAGAGNWDSGLRPTVELASSVRWSLDTCRLKLVSYVICSNTMVWRLLNWRIVDVHDLRISRWYFIKLHSSFFVVWSFLHTCLNVIIVIEVLTVHTIFLSINVNSTWDDKNAV